ncbi:MAG: hypothetical protein WCO09_03955 [bacterium]
MESNKNSEYNQNLSNSGMEDSVKKFHSKPENQEEMLENLRILKEIPEDISDPKVVIKLGDPSIPNKFISMTDEEGREYVIAMPLDRKAYHRDILALAEKLYQKEFSNVKGGYIITEGDSLVVNGSSEGFGKANHSKVARLLQEKFPNLKVINREPMMYETDQEGEVLEMVQKLNQTVFMIDMMNEELTSMINEYNEGKIDKKELSDKYSKYVSGIHSLERLAEITKGILIELDAIK